MLLRCYRPRAKQEQELKIAEVPKPFSLQGMPKLPFYRAWTLLREVVDSDEAVVAACCQELGGEGQRGDCLSGIGKLPEKTEVLSASGSRYQV